MSSAIQPSGPVLARLLRRFAAWRGGALDSGVHRLRRAVQAARPVGVAGAKWACLAALGGLGGCNALLNAGSAELAGFSGAALAEAVTTNAAVATGVGLGVQAATRASLQYSQRQVHRAVQDRIAQAAGPLAPGAVARWQIDHKLPIEKDAHGRVTVSRIISTKELQCKEIVFSVDAVDEKEPRTGFYLAAVCRDGTRWKWASAEPATERWGALQ